MIKLTILDSYHARTLKRQNPLVCFPSYFHIKAVFQKSERSFFDQVAIDAKSILTFENCLLVAVMKFKTRQLPIGAGHCQWGGCTDRNVCNIHGDAHLASRYRTMLRPGAFFRFGTLPVVGNLSRGGLLSFFNMLPIVPNLTLPGSE